MGLRGWYDSNVLPKVITAACGQPEVTELRAKVVPLAQGKVLEVGCGGGLNQSLYDWNRISELYGLDPNPQLLARARERLIAQGRSADLRLGTAEDIPFAESTFDTVVCTFTLCSVGNPERVLAELRRVLKPDGRLLYLEHGKAPDPGPARWQQRLEPLWRPLTGNCHLTRPVGPSLRAAGFEVEPLGQEYFARMPRWAGWMEWGAARRAGV